jgi:hypothetical protein
LLPSTSAAVCTRALTYAAPALHALLVSFVLTGCRLSTPIVGADAVTAAAPHPSPPNKMESFRKEVAILKQMRDEEMILTHADYEVELIKTKQKFGIGAQQL